MTGSDRDKVALVIKGVFDAFASGDVGTIEAHLDADCTIWDVFTPELIKGPAARSAFHEADQRQARARGRLTYRLHEPLIDIWNDTAVARYLLDFEYQPPRPLCGRIRVTDVLRRRPCGWLIAHHHEGMVPDAARPHGRTGA